MRIVLAALFISTLLFSSCNKYSEGPNYSMLTRKARLCNDWELKAYSISGNNAFDQDYSTKLSIDKDGTYSMSTTFNALGQIQGEYFIYRAHCNSFLNGIWIRSCARA